jgi:hypothetical protein
MAAQTLEDFLRECITGECISEFAISDGATDWYAESLLDFLSENESHELDELVRFENDKIYNEFDKILYELVLGFWDEDGEFVRA